MARGTTYNQLVEMVRDETGLSSNSSRGIDHRPYIERLIKRVYEFMCDEYDWPFLRVNDLDASIALQAGERYYDFPLTMDLEDTIDCSIFWGNVWMPLTYGIGIEQYSAYNSDNNAVRVDPTTNWKIHNGDQFEVWPIPATNGAIDLTASPFPTITSPIVRFTGMRKPTPLVAATDRCDMDDQVVVLFVAAEILAKQKSADADLKLAAANKRLATVRGKSADRRKIRVGMGQSAGDDRRGWPRVMVFPAAN